MKKENDVYEIDETGYVPPAVLAKMKKWKKEKEQKKGKVIKAR